MVFYDIWFDIVMEYSMPNLLLTVEYGGYISIVKFIIFLVLFYIWLPLPGWVYQDAKKVGTREVYWTAIIVSAGAAAVIFLLMPVFVVGMLLFATALAVPFVGYLRHRDSKVVEYERILTAEYIKSLFAKKESKTESRKDFIFITANNNEVTEPEARTPDFFGYKAAHEILADAIWRRANSIIFSPTHEHYKVAYYVDGTAIKQPDIGAGQIEYFSRFIKNISNMDPNEKRKPQNGKFVVRRENKNTDWEVTTAGSTAGEQIKIKRITHLEITKLADLDLTPSQLEQLDKLGKAKQGIFIVAGPKKSGVTTTLYALLRKHDAFMNSVVTLERQPSADIPNIPQQVFSISDTGTSTYAKKLLALVRTEPDIVGVAGCDDSETAKIVCKAAQSGKLMYVTLNADNAIQAVAKWMKLVEDKALATGYLLGISNQRLLRELCEVCKQGYEPNKELLRKFNIPAEKAKVLYRAGKELYSKRGKARMCDNCQGTGFVGRTCIFETIMMTGELRKAVRDSKSLSEISTHFRGAKMLYLQEQALKKVVEGTTAINEMVRILSSGKKQKAKKR